MNFTDKYTLDKTIKDEENKIELSKDYFALCEVISVLIKRIDSFK